MQVRGHSYNTTFFWCLELEPWTAYIMYYPCQVSYAHNDIVTTQLH